MGDVSFCFGHTKDGPKGGNGSRRRSFFWKIISKEWRGDRTIAHADVRSSIGGSPAPLAAALSSLGQHRMQSNGQSGRNDSD
jgi:hypothetical protein